MKRLLSRSLALSSSLQKSVAFGVLAYPRSVAGASGVAWLLAAVMLQREVRRLQSEQRLSTHYRNYIHELAQSNDVIG